MITLPQPQDVINRNEILKMSEKLINQDIRRMVKKLNTRMSRLEKSGLDKFLPSYTRVKKWITKNTDSKNEKFKVGTLSKMSIKEKSNYLAMLYHFENYKLTITDAKQVREKLRQTIKKELGYLPSNEEIDHIGELMSIVYRDSEGIDDTFRKIFNSTDAREWAVEHINWSKEDAIDFIKNLSSFADAANSNGYTDQDIKDFIDDYSNDAENYYVINGIKIDKTTGKLINNNTGEIIEEYEYDATSENIFDENEIIANVDENGIIIPLKDFLRGKYGYI